MQLSKNKMDKPKKKKTPKHKTKILYKGHWVNFGICSYINGTGSGTGTERQPA